MPKFYFNIRDHAGILRDEEGMDLPDLEAAKTEASEGAREILADALRAHREVDGKRIEILDEKGTVIETIMIRDLLGSS